MERRRWTENDIAKLREMARKKPLPQIASDLGRGVSAVAMKAHELNLSLRMKPKKSSLAPAAEPGAAGFNWLVIGK